MTLKRLGREIEHRQRHATLDPSLQLEQFEVHVDRAGQLRMLLANRLELQRFSRLGARRSWRPSGRIGHHAIIAGVRILMVGSEALPFAKTGGLADVLGALPKALTRLGHTVDLVIPRYRGIDVGHPSASIRVALGGQVDDAQISTHRESTAYARSSLDITPTSIATISTAPPSATIRTTPSALRSSVRRRSIGRPRPVSRYDVVHAHDWQAGLVPVLLKRAAVDTVRQRTPTVFTIHNLAYQGVFDASWLPRLGLGWDLMRVDAMEYWGRISYLKAGIVFSDLMTTVSPTYAQEIQTPELGFGFDGILRHRSADLVGILNGIDYDQWDPDGDPNLPEPYNASKLKGKAAAKRKLLETLRSSGQGQGPEPAAGRHDFADGRSEGFRPDRGAGRRVAEAGRRRSSCLAPASAGTRICGATWPRSTRR